MIVKSKRVKLALLLTVLASALLSNSAYASILAKVTITVVNEEAKPVEGAKVEICFRGGCLEKDTLKGVTDNNGIFSASGVSRDGQVGGAVEKAGYYPSIFHNNFVRSKLGVWQPWNKENKVMLRPKLKPVSMYVRERNITIPVADKAIGFDLIKFDWVAPYGLGSVADFIFHVKRSWDGHDNYDSTMTLTFSNKYDGIQSFELDQGGVFNVGSIFRPPRYAPESGYQSKLVTHMNSNAIDKNAYITNDTFHFFRIRSEVDKNGKLKRAMYGKMQGRLKADPRSHRNGAAVIELFYWLNPDYTRNLEFDIDRNLFSPFPKDEQSIRIP